jgi:hypothetical protein
VRALTGTLPGLNGLPEGRCWGGSREVKAALLLHPSRAAFPCRLARCRAPEGTRPFRRRLVTDGTSSGLSVDAGRTPPALGCHQGKGSGPTPAVSPVFSRPGPALAPPTDYTRARPCAPPRKWPEWCNGERRERVRRGGRREAANHPRGPSRPTARPPPAHIVGPAPSPVPFGIVPGHHSGGRPFTLPRSHAASLLMYNRRRAGAVHKNRIIPTVGILSARPWPTGPGSSHNLRTSR